VVNHLLFHKALVDEKDDMSRINQYLDMVKKACEGKRLSIGDPFDHSIYLTFELVLNQHLDPWDIDLVGFSSMYMKKAREEKIDLMTAGRIIYMAWRVLRMQSDTLVIDMESKEEEPCLEWEDIPTAAWLESNDGYSYTNLVMKTPSPPLEKPIRREFKRKITLIELLDAFDQAKKESEEYQILEKLRKQERDRLALKARESMKGTTHEDPLEEDIAEVWRKICRHPKKIMCLNDICETEDPDEHIKTFLSILFLVYNRKIKVYQHRFPYGKIYIKNIGYT
jgi:segregation and condensation protein A